MEKYSREYLKPFRCAGGLALFITFFSTVMVVVATPLTFILGPLVKSEKMAGELVSLVTTFAMLYSYYIGYRIFVKKYCPKVIDTAPVKKNMLVRCLISMILIFGIIRLSWQWWFSFLKVEGGVEGELAIIQILYTVILGPIAEEMVFRGWMMGLLRRYGGFTAILISAFSFGIFHGNLYQAVPAFIIGLALGYLAITYESLWPGIILHIANNALSTIGVLNEANFVTVYLVMTIVWLVAVLVINRNKLVPVIKQTVQVPGLTIKSISFIVFLIASTVMIVLSVLQI